MTLTLSPSRNARHEAIQFAINCLATPEAASALAAVVQRETEKAQKEMASNAYQVLGAIFGATCNPIPRIMEWFYSAAQGRVSPDLFPLSPEECSVFKQSLEFKKLADLK